jgi:hypothetical protein
MRIQAIPAFVIHAGDTKVAGKSATRTASN